MARVQFPFKVKYSGIWRPAHNPFDVDDVDLPELVKVGAIVVEAVAPQDNKDGADTKNSNTEGENGKVGDTEGKVDGNTTEDGQGGSTEPKQEPPVGGTEPDKEPPVEEEAKQIPTKTELLNMKSAEIKDYATNLGVDLTGCTNNEQRATAIMQHFSK